MITVFWVELQSDHTKHTKIKTQFLFNTMMLKLMIRDFGNLARFLKLRCSLTLLFMTKPFEESRHFTFLSAYFNKQRGNI